MREEHKATDRGPELRAHMARLRQRGKTFAARGLIWLFCLLTSAMDCSALRIVNASCWKLQRTCFSRHRANAHSGTNEGPPDMRPEMIWVSPSCCALHGLQQRMRRARGGQGAPLVC